MSSFRPNPGGSADYKVLNIMVRELKESEINDFINFGDKLYKNDPLYVPYMRGDLKKTIKRLVFDEKKYKALISVDEDKIKGRVLLTVVKNKQLRCERCGYFSHFEVVEDVDVCRELMKAAEEAVKEMGGEYLLGSFFNDDQDNRRGILVDGFEYAPMILTSHNPTYYGPFLESCGYIKLIDALEYEVNTEPVRMAKLDRIAQAALRKNNVYISCIDLKNIDRDIKDIHYIMQQATTEINFEEAPSEEDLRKYFKAWKKYINPEFVFVVRKKENDTPVGFSLSIPDYNEVIRAMRGRMDLKGLWAFVTTKNRITGARGILQYVIPEYQAKGITAILYARTKVSYDKYHLTRMTMGTIMENNVKSNSSVIAGGGELSRVYRMFYKKLEDE